MAARSRLIDAKASFGRVMGRFPALVADLEEEEAQVRSRAAAERQSAPSTSGRKRAERTPPPDGPKLPSAYVPLMPSLRGGKAAAAVADEPKPQEDHRVQEQGAAREVRSRDGSEELEELAALGTSAAHMELYNHWGPTDTEFRRDPRVLRELLGLGVRNVVGGRLSPASHLVRVCRDHR